MNKQEKIVIGCTFINKLYSKGWHESRGTFDPGVDRKSDGPCIVRKSFIKKSCSFTYSV